MTLVRKRLTIKAREIEDVWQACWVIKAKTALLANKYDNENPKMLVLEIFDKTEHIQSFFVLDQQIFSLRVYCLNEKMVT